MFRLVPYMFAMLLAGCLHNDQFVIPVTGKEDTAVPVLVEMAKENVLGYLISSSRLATDPPDTDWQLDQEEQQEGVHRFHNGDWLMAIWFNDANDERSRVVIMNKVKNISWCGYVESDGHVVDTAWIR